MQGMLLTFQSRLLAFFSILSKTLNTIYWLFYVGVKLGKKMCAVRVFGYMSK